jgi:hypothetical protein
MATEYVIRNATAEQVVDGGRQAAEEMGFQVIRGESTDDGQISVLAGEGALVPLVVKTLLVPLGLDDFVRVAQRSGVHRGISPQEEAIHLYVCGITLEETSGKFERFTEADLMEQVTDTMEAWDFKDQFAQKIKARFPDIEEVK